MTVYPGSLDTFTAPQPQTQVQSATITALQQAVAALQTKVGITGSADSSSVDYKLAHTGGTWPYVRRAANQTATGDPATVFTAGANLVNGTSNVAFFTATDSFTTTQVRYHVATVATSSSAGTSIGLFSIDASDNGTLIASVTSTALFTTTTGLRTASWAASVALTAGSRYAVAFLNIAGSGTPALFVCGSNTGNWTEMAQVPHIGAQLPGQSGQASFVVGSLVNNSTPPYAVIL